MPNGARFSVRAGVLVAIRYSKTTKPAAGTLRLTRRRFAQPLARPEGEGHQNASLIRGLSDDAGQYQRDHNRRAIGTKGPAPLEP